MCGSREDDGSDMIVSRVNGDKVNSALSSRSGGPGGQWRRLSPSVNVNCVQDEITRLRAAGVKMERLCLSAQHLLERTKRIRAAAGQYQEEMTELKRRTSDEIRELLASLRVVRDVSLAVLETQQKFVDAARIRSMSPGFQEDDVEGSGGELGEGVAGDASSLSEGEPPGGPERRTRKTELQKSN